MNELLSFILRNGDQFRRLDSRADLVASALQRLPSLYSDFTLQRHSNPDGFTANTSAWIDVLGNAAKAGLLPADGSDRNLFSLATGDALLHSLETKEWGRPLAIATVIDEAVLQRQIMAYTDYIAPRKSIYELNWTVQPRWLLSWGLRQLGLRKPSINAGTLRQGRFVLLRNVEEAASKIVNQIGGERNQINRIFPMSFFRTEVTRITNSCNRLTDSDLKIILTHLDRDKSAIVYDDQTVKFNDPGETSCTLSDGDRTISSLKVIIADLSEQVTQVSKRVALMSDTAQEALRNNNRVSALAALRSKKLNETTLTERSETLARLEEVYSKIEQATDQSAIVRVMEASTAVLRSLYVDMGGVNKVEGVIEDLREEMSKVDEVSSALEAGGQGDDVVDESAVNEEFEELERQSILEEEKARVLYTQKRLATIDDFDAANEARESQQATTTKPQDVAIEEGTKALNRLSLERQATPDIENGKSSQALAE